MRARTRGSSKRSYRPAGFGRLFRVPERTESEDRGRTSRAGRRAGVLAGPRARFIFLTLKSNRPMKAQSRTVNDDKPDREVGFESRPNRESTHRGDPTFPGRGANVRDAADGHRARHDGVRLRADAASVFAIRPRSAMEAPPRWEAARGRRGDRGRRGSEFANPAAGRARAKFYI